MAEYHGQKTWPITMAEYHGPSKHAGLAGKWDVGNIRANTIRS